MNLIDCLDLKKGSIISIVGAGGKTTFLYNLAEELRLNNKILLSTTTKIYLPKKAQYDFLTLNKLEFDSIKIYSNQGIYVYGRGVNSDGKMLGIDGRYLKKELQYFDYILIEADGSKRKPLKGWLDTEPVISEDTTMTLGIVNIATIGKKINDHNIHRVKPFLQITNAIEDETVTVNHLKSLILHKDGLFKQAKGKKILFINQVETEKNLKDTQQLVNLLNKQTIIDKIIVGSLKNKNYHVISGEVND